jgi:hypothetical protein
VLGIKGNPTHDSDGNTVRRKDESPKSAMKPIPDAKLETVMDIGSFDNNVKNMNVHLDTNDKDVKNVDVHTKKDGILHNPTTYADIVHGSTRRTNVADELPGKRKKVVRITI